MRYFQVSEGERKFLKDTFSEALDLVFDEDGWKEDSPMKKFFKEELLKKSTPMKIRGLWSDKLFEITEVFEEVRILH